jgi:hypothetical protein
MKMLKAFWLGFREHIFARSDMGITYDDDALSDAYDRGWNIADWLRWRK